MRRLRRRAAQCADPTAYVAGAYISSCLRTPAARCAAGAHGALGRVLQQTVQRHASRHGAAAWLSCQSQSKCVPFANFAKNSEIFQNCAEKRKEKKTSAISENLFFAEICLPLPRFAGAPTWSLLLLRSNCALAPSALPSENEYIPLLIFLVPFPAASSASITTPMRHVAPLGCVCSAPLPPPLLAACGLAVADCLGTARRLPLPVGFLPPHRRHSKPVSGTCYGLCVCFSPCPSAFYRRTTKNCFCQITRLQDTTKIVQIIVTLLDGWI